MSVTPDPFERRLADGLNRVAGQVNTSPDALERIDARLAVQRHRRPASADIARTPFRPPSRRRGMVLIPALSMAVVLVLTAIIAARVGQRDTRLLVPASGVRTLSPGDNSPVPRLPAGVGPVAYMGKDTLTVASTDRAPIEFSAKQLATAQWSADGLYLSYSSNPSGKDGASRELHIVTSDGKSDRVVYRGHLWAAWSGVGHELAAAPVPVVGGAGGLVVIPAEGEPRQLVPVDVPVFSFAWSNKTTTLAYSVRSAANGHDELRTIDAETGASTQVAMGPRDGGLIVAKWWPDDRGLMWWIDPAHDGTLRDQGGLMLETSSLQGPPRDLLRTFVYRDWLTFSPDGKTLALVAGTGQSPSSGKSLALCDAVEATCVAVSSPRDSVVLDPAWSSDGRHLAFVVAASEMLGSNDRFDRWYRSRRLWTADADGTGASEVVGAPPGVSAPSWASAGDFLRYSTASAVEVIPAGGGAPSTVVGSLSGGSGSGPDGFGKTPWNGLALWAS